MEEWTDRASDQRYTGTVREMHMTIDEAIRAVTVGGARALRRDDVGSLAVGATGHAVILDAPTHHHLAYRPGVPLIRRTIGPLTGGGQTPSGHEAGRSARAPT